MEIEIVRTINGRKATRAKAWRICETGVTYFDPGLAVSRPAARRSRARLSADEQLVLATLRACGRSSFKQVRAALPVQLSNDAVQNALRRLVTVGYAVEHEMKTRGPVFRVVTYEAIHDPGD